MNKTEITKIVEKELLEFFDAKTLLIHNKEIMEFSIEATLKAINYTHCCETLIDKKVISFDDFLKKFYIENGLNYQSKRTSKIVDIDEPKKRYDWYCKYN